MGTPAPSDTAIVFAPVLGVRFNHAGVVSFVKVIAPAAVPCTFTVADEPAPLLVVMVAVVGLRDKVGTVVANTADELAVTARFVLLVTSSAAGIVTAICAVLAAVGVPLMAMVTWVALFLAAVCVMPAGRLVIHPVVLVSDAANVSFVSVITTLPPALPMVVLAMVADGGAGSLTHTEVTGVVGLLLYVK